MGLLSDVIGTIVSCGANAASSDGKTASDFTGVNIQGMGSVLFFAQVITAGATDGGMTDGSIYVQFQYSSASANGSDAATSNSGMSCTDAILTFNSTDDTAGAFRTLEINISAKGFPDGGGYLFPSTHGDSLSVLRVYAIPVPATRTLPIAQSNAVVIADD